jgi:hypothetical protein
MKKNKEVEGQHQQHQHLDYDYHRIKQKSRMWDRAEDAVLMRWVDALGNNWKAIGHRMSRTNVQVMMMLMMMMIQCMIR